MKSLLKNENFLALLIFIAVIFVVYSQVAFFGKSLLSTLYYPKQLSVEDPGRIPVNTFNVDLATPSFFEIPINKLVGDMYKKGILPLWNPYQACGTPLAAQYSTRVFFPYQILENISPVVLWDYFMLGRLIIAAFFTYLLLRLLGISPPSSFLGGVFYGLCGSFTHFINLEEFTNVAMMVPICIFSLERLVRYRKGRHIAECALVIALMLLAGQPEIAVYVMLLAASYYIFRIAVERQGFLAFLKDAFKFAGIVALALGICALLILPFLELIPISYQCHPPGGTMGGQEPTRLMVAMSIIAPYFFELPTNYRVFPHNGVWDWLGGYSGTLAAFLILLGFFSKGKARKFFLFFSLFGLFIVLKNFGFLLASWLGSLPLFDQSWSPRWAGPVWTFSLSCGAAIGFDMARQTEFKKNVLFGILGFSLLAIGFLLYKTGYIPQLFRLNAEELSKAIPPIAGSTVVSICVVLVAASLFLYFRRSKGLVYAIIFLAISELWFCVPKGAPFPWTAFKLAPFALGIVIVFLLAKEKWRIGLIGIALMAVSFTFIDVGAPKGFPDRRDLFKEPGFVTFLKQDAGYSRVIGGNGALMPNFSSSYQIFDIGYINSLSSAQYQNYVDNHLLEAPHAWITDRLWFTGIADLHKQKLRSIYQEIEDNLIYYSYLGVKYIVCPKDVTLRIPLVYDENVKVYKNPRAFPRAYVATDIKIVPDFQQAQELMKTKDIDLLNTAILEEGMPDWYRPPPVESGNSKAEIRYYGPRKVKIRADMDTDGIMVLTDVMYPGWRAYVDNEESRIYRVNGLVRGVFLTSGSHEIIFKYDPLSFKMGLLISMISVLTCLALIKKG